MRAASVGWLSNGCGLGCFSSSSSDSRIAALTRGSCMKRMKFSSGTGPDANSST
jgi:hypothetical protein